MNCPPLDEGKILLYQQESFLNRVVPWIMAEPPKEIGRSPLSLLFKRNLDLPTPGINSRCQTPENHKIIMKTMRLITSAGILSLASGFESEGST